MTKKLPLGAAFAAVLLAAGALRAAEDPHAGPAMNYHAVDERLATSGHFTHGGLEALAGKGLDAIIELREEPPEGRKAELAAKGIQWVHVPVDWNDPQPGDFDRFKDAMGRHDGDRVLVQCAANYRASAMTYLYRVVVEGVPQSEARDDLLAVWSPNKRWRDYIESIESGSGR